MQTLAIDADLLPAIIDGSKTLECFLGAPEILKIRVGHELAVNKTVTVKVTQLLYFETFEEAFGAHDYKMAQPDAVSRYAALKKYNQRYSEAEEYENGVVAISFELVK